MAQAAQDILQKHCKPCEGGVSKYSKQEILEHMPLLDKAWTLDEKGTALCREFKFKGFAKTMYFVNAVAYLADQEAHHPDICFGWGYCNVRFTTHAIEGLSENDFICAAKLDKLVAE